MQRTYDDFTRRFVGPLDQDLSTDDLVIVEDLSCQLCGHISLLEYYRAFTIVLVLGFFD